MTLKNLQNEAYKVRMTPAEKAAMRAQIFGLPAQAGAPASVATHTASPYFFFDFQFMSRAVAAMLMVMLVGGGGIAYAAEGSLPGETLYTVKRNVTEPLKTALAANPSARAAVHVELAQRRVEEAEALAVKGALDATTTAELEESFESHAQSVDELALEVGATDPSAAVEIKAELASSLGVHGALLATLASQKEQGSNKQNSEQLASRVIARANVAAGMPAKPLAAKAVALTAPVLAPGSMAKSQAVSTFAITTTSEVAADTAGAAAMPAPSTTTADSGAGASADMTMVQERGSGEGGDQDSALKVRAENALEKAKDAYDDKKSKFDNEARSSLEQQLADVQTQIDAGNYTDALRLALKLQVAIKAQAKYRTNIITPLFKLELNLNDEH